LGDASNNAVDTHCNDANESSTVNKATPTLTTTVKDKDGNTVDNTHPAAQTTTVHDTAQLSGQVNGFGFNGTATVTYSFFTNNDCSGTPASEPKTVAVDGTVPPSSAQTLGPGSYSYKAVYSGNAYYYGSTSLCEPFRVVQKSLITDSSLCTFDIDSGTPGSQFRLIYTPDLSTWKLNASNPGQFYYNVFDNAPTGTVYFTLPYPFVTQGAVPIHVYSSVTIATVNGHTCLIPGIEIAHSSAQVTLASYSDTNGNGSVGFGDTATVSVTFSSPSGFAYANIHVDYGLKGTNNYSKDANNNAIDATTRTIRIPDNQSYTFREDDGTPDSQSVSSRNSFKRDPGIAGLVRRSGTDMPVPNAEVTISGDGQKQTVYTDEDGWYMWQYKYTGKPAAFTVKLATYNLSQTVTLKSNGFVVVSFSVP
jgi:YHS domain-containing protein